MFMEALVLYSLLLVFLADEPFLGEANQIMRDIYPALAHVVKAVLGICALVSVVVMIYRIYFNEDRDVQTGGRVFKWFLAFAVGFGIMEALLRVFGNDVA